MERLQSLINSFIKDWNDKKHESSIKDLRLAFSGWELSWDGFISNKKGEWLLFSQLIIIFAHLILPLATTSSFTLKWPFQLTTLGLLIIFLGFTQAIKSFLDLGASLSPLPEPKKNAKFISSGIYKECRHPLYKSLLIISSGFILLFGSLLHLFLFITLSIILKYKAKYEESKLISIHPQYIEYKRKTYAIFNNVPFLDWRE